MATGSGRGVLGAGEVTSLPLYPFDQPPVSRVEDMLATDDSTVLLAVTYGSGQRAEHGSVVLALDGAGIRGSYTSPVDQYPPGDPTWRRIGLRRRDLGLTPFVSAPREQGATALALFQGPRDLRPVPYAATLSAAGSRALCKTESGWAALPPIADDVIGVARLAAAGAWLIAAGLPGSSHPIYVTQDPQQGWTALAPKGFAAERNLAVTSAAAFAGRLYCGTLNSTYGWQLWSAPLDERLADPVAWEPVLTGAAGRYSLIDELAQVAVFQDALYLAACAASADSVSEETPVAGAELIRVGADHRWDLLCGTPRFSPQGLKRPTLGGQGFGDPGNQCFRSLLVYEDRLYIGTHNASGCQLWRTDGHSAECVLDSGWDGIDGVTISALAGARDGLVIGVEGSRGLGLARYVAG